MSCFSETKSELFSCLCGMSAAEFDACLAALDRGEFGPSDLSAAEAAKFRAILEAFRAAIAGGSVA